MLRVISAHDYSGELGLHEAATQCGSVANRELVQAGYRDYSPQVGFPSEASTAMAWSTAFAFRFPKRATTATSSRPYVTDVLGGKGWDGRAAQREGQTDVNRLSNAPQNAPPVPELHPGSRS